MEAKAVVGSTVGFDIPGRVFYYTSQRGDTHVAKAEVNLRDMAQ